MTLLGQLVEEASGSTVVTAELLRRLKVVASRAKVPELASWVHSEMHGYGPDDALPSYRGPFPVPVLGTFSGAFGQLASNIPIPPIAFPENLRNGRLFNLSFTQSVGELEALRDTGKGGKIPWPADAVALSNHMTERGQMMLMEGMGLVEAYTPLSTAWVSGVLDEVRNQVLELALNLEGAAPQAGESGADVNEQAARAAVTVVINGSHNHVAAAGSQASQLQTTTSPACVRFGDRKSLLGALHAAGVPEDERDALVADLDADLKGRILNQGELPGPRVSKRLSTWALTSGGTIAVTLAGQALARFFGVS